MSSLEAGSPELEKVIELLSTKCQTAAAALNRNLLNQIISFGIGLGLVVGLGKALSIKIFGESGDEPILYLIIPYINVYLLMRFGQIVSYFSTVRTALQEVAEKYCVDAPVSGLLGALSTTNSYIDYFYRKEFLHTSKGYLAVLIFYSLSLPAIAGSNYAVSIYLIFKAPIQSNSIRIILMAAYLIPTTILNVAFHSANKDFAFKDFAEFGGKKVDYVLMLLATSIIFALIAWCLIVSGLLTNSGARPTP
jgi:hypothetical protein